MKGPPRLALLTATVAAVTVLSLACRDDATSPAATATVPQPPPATSPIGTPPTPATPSSAATSTPAVRVGNEPVGFETEDGVVVRGHLFEPTGPRRKVAVLAHASTNDQRAWTGFAQELARQGIAALTFDFRGFGETGGQRDIANLHRDLDAAVRFLRSRDYTQVYIIGEEMGGTAALKVAARQDLAGVVTLSARLSIMGLTAEPDLASVTEPKLFLVAQGDAQGTTAAAAFMSATAGQKESHVFAGSAVGVSLLQGATGEAVRQRILQFLNP